MQAKTFLFLQNFVIERNAFVEYFKAITFLQSGKVKKFQKSITFLANAINCGKIFPILNVEYFLRGPWGLTSANFPVRCLIRRLCVFELPRRVLRLVIYQLLRTAPESFSGYTCSHGH